MYQALADCRQLDLYQEQHGMERFFVEACTIFNTKGRVKITSGTELGERSTGGAVNGLAYHIERLRGKSNGQILWGGDRGGRPERSEGWA